MAGEERAAALYKRKMFRKKKRVNNTGEGLSEIAI